MTSTQTTRSNSAVVCSSVLWLQQKLLGLAGSPP
jgi:hypothetical protein